MRLLLILVVLSGCATVPSASWAPSEFARVVLPVYAEPTATSPATEPAPGRVELDEVVVGYLLDVEGMYGPARHALGVCYEGRDGDRVEARAIMLALEAQRAEARKGQIRAALVGASVGAVGVLAGVVAILLGTL